jgi:putative transposase
MGTRLQGIIAEVIGEGDTVDRDGGMADQLHLLVEVIPQFRIHRLVKQIKGRSSGLLRQRFPWLCPRLPTLWTNSHFVATVGGALRSVITRYVDARRVGERC